ncbi:MAG: hypothetical protein AAF632_04905 [Bacteroidota bacterium]
MPVFLLLNFLIMPLSDSLIIELDPATHPDFHKEIEIALTNPNFTDLTISLKANNQWIVFGSPPKIDSVPLEVEEFTYSIKHEVDSLPEGIGDLDSLQSLKVEFLGLSSLPNSIVHLSKLKELDISFNKLEDANLSGLLAKSQYIEQPTRRSDGYRSLAFLCPLHP